ncbi:hypothetical protein [Rhizobium sp. SYY.PMSO]|uniref:hypothetical protein n=1 Tax=Rhizobium sp. SYY.PMSO TaxID=3382192 RepID=UPI000DE18783
MGMATTAVRFISRYKFRPLTVGHIAVEIRHCPYDGDGFKLRWIYNARSNQLDQPNRECIQAIVRRIEPRLTGHQVEYLFNDLKVFRA